MGSTQKYYSFHCPNCNITVKDKLNLIGYAKLRLSDNEESLFLVCVSCTSSLVYFSQELKK